MAILEEFIKKEAANCPGRISVCVESDIWKFEHNGSFVYSSASLIKVPILIEALRQHEQGLISLEYGISLEDDAKAGGSGVIQALENSNWKVRDLLTLMIIVSDNIATNLLIDLLGMKAINQCMTMMGLKETKLQRKMMDFGAIEQGLDNKTCAIDMVRCLKVFTQDSFLSKESVQVAKDIMQFQQFKDKIPAFIDHEKAYVGSKTGGLPGVEHDCAIISYEGKTAYAAILVDQIPEGKSAAPTLQNIGKAVFEELIK